MQFNNPNIIHGAISSLKESCDNSMEIVEINLNRKVIKKKDIKNIKYPASKIMWNPYPLSYGYEEQVIGVASDKMRLYSYGVNSGLRLKTELKNTLLKDLSAPLTSFDWSPNTNFICCSSIDTTCTLFDVNTESFYKQLIAHDKEVIN